MLTHSLTRLAAVALMVVMIAGCGSDEKTMTQATPPALTGTSWLAEDIGGAGTVETAKTTMTFDAEGKVYGSGGCNRFFGPVTIKGNAIRFGLMGSTMMACPEPQMDQERKFFDALTGVRSYRMEDPGGKLVLLAEDGAPLVRFRPLKPGS
jgi:putative lipoprotein